MEKIVESPRAASEQLELNYNRKIMKKIYVFYDDQEFVDVVFNVSNPTSTVSAHRLILAAASPYFRRMFNSAEGENCLITIAGIDSDVFERLVAFCYNGKARLTIDNVGSTLKGAMRLELTDAVTECANYLINHLSEYTLPKAISLVNETGCEIIKKRTTDYIIANFEKVSQDSQHTLNELSVQQMEIILLNPAMRTYDQNNLFEVIKRWYEHDKHARELLLPNLIGSLQLADFDSEFLEKQIRPLPGCTDLVDKEIQGRKEGNSLLLMKPYERAENVLLRYNKKEDEWLKCDVKSDPLNIKLSIYFNKKIYYAAYDDSRKVYSFDLQSKTRSSLPPILNIRNIVSVVLLDEKIYVIGIKNDYSGQMSMEMFNPSIDKWQTKADGPKTRLVFGVVALNGKIYVFGGQSYLTNQTLAEVHSYDPKTNIWTECAPLAEGRKWHGVAVHKGHIYVLGGYSEGKYMSSVERYNPDRNEWTKIGSLNEARRYICGISFNNELLAIGGSGAYGDSSLVEVYDEENDKWVVKKGLPYSGEFNTYVVPTALIDFIRHSEYGERQRMNKVQFKPSNLRKIYLTKLIENHSIKKKVAQINNT